MSDFLVIDLLAPIRLSEYVHTAFPSLLSKSMGKKYVKRGLVNINGRVGKTSDWVENGMKLAINQPPQSKVSKHSRSLTILWEDDHLAVIVKPAGINVSGNRASIVNSLSANLAQSAQEDAMIHYLPVHRLDRDTKGLLLIAKTRIAHLKLSAALSNYEIKKVYNVLSVGSFDEKTGKIESDVDGKKAFTSYEVIEQVHSQRFGTLSLLKVSIATGRTHQIRIHLSSIGHPILGDRLHNNDIHLDVGKGLFLFATGLSFIHPKDGYLIEVKMELPPKVNRMMRFESMIR